MHWLGIVAAITLIISCFLPWAYYPDLKDTFTGFYSYQNQYGKPGKMIVVISAIVLLFILLPKIWAKRVNLFLAALGLGYAIKSYILYSGCYNTYCPQKQAGIYVMIFSAIILLITTAFPQLKIQKRVVVVEAVKE